MKKNIIALLAVVLLCPMLSRAASVAVGNGGTLYIDVTFDTTTMVSNTATDTTTIGDNLSTFTAQTVSKFSNVALSSTTMFSNVAGSTTTLFSGTTDKFSNVAVNTTTIGTNLSTFVGQTVSKFSNVAVDTLTLGSNVAVSTTALYSAAYDQFTSIATSTTTKFSDVAVSTLTLGSNIAVSTSTLGTNLSTFSGQDFALLSATQTFTGENTFKNGVFKSTVTISYQNGADLINSPQIFILGGISGGAEERGVKMVAEVGAATIKTFSIYSHGTAITPTVNLPILTLGTYWNDTPYSVAAPQGAFSVGTSTFSVSNGQVSLPVYTVAQIQGLTPPSGGCDVKCSNCPLDGTIGGAGPYAQCTSSGTGVGAYVYTSSMTAACGW